MARAASEPFHVGVTPELIVDTAQELTRSSNLFGWSIRDLARELNVTPSVVYHHVGGKDLIAKHLSERVVSAVAMPDPELEWQDWFRALLVDSIYSVTIDHPGVAKWLLMHGVPFPSATGIFETGVGKLQAAGAEHAFMAYSVLLNNAVMTISMGDERLLHEDDGPRDHAAMMEEFQQMFASSSGIAKIGGEFIAEFAKGGEAAAQMRERYYRYVVDVTIAGVGALMGRGAGDGSRPLPPQR